MGVFVVRCEQASQPSIAPQPLGFTAGVKGCEERVEQLRRSSSVDERQVLVAVASFFPSAFVTWSTRRSPRTPSSASLPPARSPRAIPSSAFHTS